MTGNFTFLELSTTVEYALVILVELAKAYKLKKPVKISDIASKHKIPEFYLTEILADMSSCGLICNNKNLVTEYVLAKEPNKISLLDVFLSVEGEEVLQHLFSRYCSDKSIIPTIWQQAYLAAKISLQRQTLADLCRQLHLSK